MIIVLVSGKAESGKDTFHQLAERYLRNRKLYLDSDIDIRRVAIADGVKDIAKEMGWNGEKDELGRSGLVMVGDGAINYFDKNIWIKKVVNKLKSIANYNNENIVFITDCRYPNEVTMIKDWAYLNNHKAVSVRVERPNHISKLTPEQLLNASEVALDDKRDLFDYIIYNDGTLEEFEDGVREIIDRIIP